MSNFDFGMTILNNSLIDFLANDYPFRGEKNTDGDRWRYFFGPNTNRDQQKQILIRANVKRKVAVDWSSARRREAGNPRVTWLVSKVLSTTTLVITDWETHSVWWDVYHNSTDEATALTCLATHNGVWADFTLAENINAFEQVGG